MRARSASRLHRPCGVVLGLVLGAFGCDADRQLRVSQPWEGDGAGGQGGSAIPARFKPLVDTITVEQQQLAAPGVAIAIIEKGQVTFARGFGTKRPGDGDPVLATTLFRLASNTKKHTTVGLLRLVEQGLVALAEPVTSYVPDFRFAFGPSWAQGIAVEDLLTHTSAMVDWLDVDSPQTGDDALSEHFTGGWFTQHGYVMAPAGAVFNYSNPNFMVAGLVIERTTGQPYRQYMSEQVYAPLGMTRTFFLPAEVLADGDYAWGRTDDAWTPNPSGQPMVVGPDSYDNGWGRPCAYAFSSVLDEAQFLLFLRNGAPNVLGDELRQAMQAPHESTETLLDLETYGYGLFVDRGVFLDGGASFYDVVRITHHGALPGYSSDFEFFPGLDFGFITLASSDGAYFDRSLGVALETLCDLPEPAVPPDLSPSPSSYGAYLGEYFDPFSVGRILVTQQGDELRFDMPALDHANVPYDPVLYPVAPNNFYENIAGIVGLVTFVLDGHGQARYYRTHGFVGRRVLPEDSAEQPQPRRSPEQLLRQLRAAQDERSTPMLSARRRD